MKLKEFLANLNELVKSDSSILEYDVLSAKDDEGNGFSIVHYTPAIGHFDSEDKEFTSLENLHETDFTEDDMNAICIN